MLEYLSALIFPVHIHFIFQKCIKVSLGPGETFRNHHLSSPLLHIPQESLVVRVKAVGLFRLGYRCLWIEGSEISQRSCWRDTGFSQKCVPVRTHELAYIALGKIGEIGRGHELTLSGLRHSVENLCFQTCRALLPSCGYHPGPAGD